MHFSQELCELLLPPAGILCLIMVSTFQKSFVNSCCPQQRFYLTFLPSCLLHAVRFPLYSCLYPLSLAVFSSLRVIQRWLFDQANLFYLSICPVDYIVKFPYLIPYLVPTCPSENFIIWWTLQFFFCRYGNMKNLSANRSDSFLRNFWEFFICQKSAHIHI